jgi:uncharacterized protein (TIRG00374 family)
VKKHIVNIVKLLISIGLGCLLVWLSIRNLTEKDWDEMSQAFNRANIWWLIAGPSIGMLSNLVRALRWEMLLNSLGYKPRFSNVAAAVYVMYLGNLAFPRLGEITRCGILYKTDGVPIEKSIGTMVLERVVDMLTLLIVGIALFFIEYDLLSSLFQQYILAPINAKIGSSSVSGVVFNGILLAIFSFSLFWLYKNADKNRFLNIVKQKIMGLIKGIFSIKDVDKPVLFIFHSILVWAMYFAMTYCNFMALTETAGLGTSAALSILFFGTFAFIATQGGIGAYPLITREILILFGVAANIGYAWGWISWSLQTFMVIIGGLLSLAYLSFFAKSTAVKIDESIR